MKTAILPILPDLPANLPALYTKYLLSTGIIIILFLTNYSSLSAQSLGKGGSLSLGSFAITSSGQLFGWGINRTGQLGDARYYHGRNIPYDISVFGELPHKKIVSVATGVTFTVALDDQGNAYAWGYGRFDKNAFMPGVVKLGIKALAAGDLHYSLLKTDGTVYAESRVFPEYGSWQNYLTDIVDMAAGPKYTLLLKSDGTVYLWVTWRFSSEVKKVEGLTDIVAVAAGYSHHLALKADGTVYAWGLGDYGQLGNGIFYPPSTRLEVPMQIPGLTGVKAIAAGIDHSLALKADGTAYAWGLNNAGQLGNGSFTNSAVPVQVNGLSGIREISSGRNHSLALLTNGNIYAWGDNSYGQLGNGTNINSALPVQVKGLNLYQPPYKYDLALTTKVTQAEPWYGMWGYSKGAGAIDLTVTGGTPPYAYKWNAGVTTQDIPVASPGHYSITVTDARGITATTSAYVGRKNDFLRVLSSHRNVSTTQGNDGSIDLTVVGGVAPATFRWSNGATTEDLTNLAAGTYKVLVTDAFGRQATTSVIITNPAAPLSLNFSTQNVSAAGKADGSVDLTVLGGEGPYNITWRTGDYNQYDGFSVGPRTEDLPFAAAGYYTVFVADALHQTAMATVKVEVGRTPALLNQRPNTYADILSPNSKSLTAYPNPALDKVAVNFNLSTAGKYTLDLYDIRGAKIKTLATGQAQVNKATTVELNVSAFAKGIYLLKLQNNQGVTSQRIMIHR
jgi:alpha-tubulin suppressor-like RCC1 family protein